MLAHVPRTTRCVAPPYDECVRELVAIDLPCTPRLFEIVVREWDQGNAIMLLDQRLSSELKRQHVERAAATRVIGPNEDVVEAPGIPVEDGDALVVMTSGSTGEPRGAVHTHHSIAAAALASSTRLSSTPDDHWLLCIPPSHVGGFSVFSRCHLSGMSMTVHRAFDAEHVMNAARTGVTHVSLVLTALRRIDASVFRKILLGGSSVPHDLPPNVITTYGMTETMGGVVYDGRALDGVALRIIDDEIHIKSPSLMRCYRHGPNTPEWFATGDLGKFGSSGLLEVLGRRGDLIVSGGEKVWPKPVEDVLLEHSEVLDCAVRGLPDAQWGSRVVAWVVTGDSPPPAQELQELVRQRLSPIHTPKEIRFVDHIPRTALGKIDQPALLRCAWR